MFSGVLDWLQSSPQPVVLAGAGLIALGEAVVGVGLLLPGEAAMLIASSTVDSVTEFLLLWTVATVFSIAGNVIGFELGHRLGPSLRETKLIKKRGAEGWDKASELLRKHGARAVFVGRLIPLVRGFVPAVAGAAGMSYRTFLPPVAAGATISTVLPILFAPRCPGGVVERRYQVTGSSWTPKVAMSCRNFTSSNGTARRRVGSLRSSIDRASCISTRASVWPRHWWMP